MAANKTIRFGPVALTNVIANLINPPTVSGGTGLTGTNTGTYVIIRKITVVNKGASVATFSLYLGATGGQAAGTEVGATGQTVAVGGQWVWVGMLKLDVADFLTGLASANTLLVFQAEGEIGVAG